MATVGQSRIAKSSDSNSFPMNDFRDTPSNNGRPAGLMRSSARSKARLCSSDFPKPIPGSKHITSSPIPAAFNTASRSWKNSATSATTSP